MNKSDVVKSWKIRDEYYISKHDKVQIKTTHGLVEGTIQDIDDKGPKVFVGPNTTLSIAISDMDWIHKIDHISYEPGDRTLVDVEEDKE